MELFIRLKNGQPFEHPIFGDNFREAFPDVDVNNLPEWAARFERTPCPEFGKYEVNEGVSYEWIDGVVKDVWHIRPMNEQEILNKKQIIAEEIAASVSSLKSEALENAAQAKDDVTRVAWEQYHAELEAWVLVDVDNPNVPRPPIVREDGTVLSVNASGSQPNVIG